MPLEHWESGSFLNSASPIRSKTLSIVLAATRLRYRAAYRLEAQKHPALPVLITAESASTEEAYKFDSRGQRIVARMDWPGGGEKKVRDCTSNTATKIKKALVSEDFKNKPDDEI